MTTESAPVSVCLTMTKYFLALKIGREYNIQPWQFSVLCVCKYYSVQDRTISVIKVQISLNLPLAKSCKIPISNKDLKTETLNLICRGIYFVI